MWKEGRRLYRILTLAALSTLLLPLWWMWAAPSVGDPPLEYSTEIIAADGETLRLYTTRDGYWRLPVASRDLDPRFVRLLLAYEDRRFHSHFGVDLLALGRAAWQALLAGRFVSGASTLTMQTVRLLQPRPRTLANKLAEMWRALALERNLSKREILELYLNLAPYGGNLQGVRAASRFYFGKEPRFLSTAEAALLVALPQSPERRRPDRFPTAAREARSAVLQRMLTAGLLTARQVASAESQPLPEVRLTAPRLAPHYADRMRANRPGQDLIHTRLDASLQRRLQAIARRHQARQGTGVTLAMLVLDNHGGEVRAYLGSGDYMATRFPGQVDMVRAVRSPGSTLKPFIYGQAFDAGFLHPETLVGDRPGAVAGYDPGNFDRRYQGEISVREALRASRNVPAVRVLEHLGPARFVRRMEQAGVELRLPAGVRRPGLPVALGGVGISLEQLTGLYAALSRGGAAVGTLVGSNTEVPEARTQNPGRDAPLSPAAAWYLTDILRETPLPAGFARHQPGIAIKTGTSYGFRDAWALGYDAEHTVGIWLGRPDGGYTAGLSGLQAAVPVLLEVFDQLPRAGLAPLLQNPPSGVLRLALDQLPPMLRRLDVGSTPIGPGNRGPRILYPPEGSQVELKDAAAVLLEFSGGRGPFHWLADGRYLGTADGGNRFAWKPPTGGVVQVTVLDADGRADSVRFRVLKQGV